MSGQGEGGRKIGGVVVDRRTGVGVADLRVRGFDRDRGRPSQLLGEALTSADGNFEVSVPPGAGGGREEGALELFIMVHDADGRLLHQSNDTSFAGSEHAFGRIDVAGDAAASSEGAETTGGPGSSPGAAPLARDPSSSVGDARFHGSARRDFLVPRSPFYQGPFGRLFRQLPAWVPPGRTDAEKEANIRAIAAGMLEPDAPVEDPAGDNPAIPVGYTYFGQFVDHDITFDPASSLAKLNDPDRLVNFRTPRFDLDSLYGEGPDDEPFLYDQRPEHRGEFLIGVGPQPDEDDLPRNTQGTALIGDPRNDENIIVSQVQLAFLKLHNEVLRKVRGAEGLTGREAFNRAQNIVRWHYQWVILFDFLPRICGQDVVDAVIRPAGDDGFSFDLKFYRFKQTPYMPVEFSAAAYRFGHSQIRRRYDLNSTVLGIPIFLPPSENPGPLADLRGFRRLPSFWTLDWRRFLQLRPAGAQAQLTRRIDTKLSRALLSIPAGPDPTRGSALAELNLLRGFRLGLPSGQAVARAMKVPRLTNEQLGLRPEIAGSEAPLWFYILKEAELSGGERLGPVGARIVCETFAGLAKADPNAFFNVDPSWRPETSVANGPLIAPAHGRLQLGDLIRATGFDPDPPTPPPVAGWG